MPYYNYKKLFTLIFNETFFSENKILFSGIILFRISA